MIINYITANSRYQEPNEKALYFGIEYEIEAIKSMGDIVGNNFSCIKDGSLRHNGIEFITRPSFLDETLVLFHILHNNICFNEDYDPFSERTSIHVHVNCLNLHKYTLLNLIKLYIITEPLWMKFFSEDRQNSIFCVPISSTILQSKLNGGLYTLIKHWHKYTAFNIVPLQKYGTIEFRHMEGHNDFNRFKCWLSAIRNLFKWMYDHSSWEATNHMNVEYYIPLVRDILQPILHKDTSDLEIIEAISPTLLDIKLSLL